MWYRLIDGSFPTVYITTIGVDKKSKVFDIDGKPILVQVWDTAGQERYNSIATRYYKAADGILLVYDITDAGKHFIRILLDSDITLELYVSLFLTNRTD